MLCVCSLIGLPPGTEGQDMLSTGGKKSAFKQQSQSAGWQTGPLKTLEARHVDGGTLNLQVQVCTSNRQLTCYFNRLLVSSHAEVAAMLDCSCGRVG